MVAFLVVLGSLGLDAPVRAGEPAVRALNGRVSATYEWGRLEEERTDFGLGGGGLLIVPEQEVHRAGPVGAITIPIVERVGARAMIAPRYVRQDGEQFVDESDGPNIGLATEVFLRDPELFELGFGLNYSYQELADAETNVVKGVFQGSLFFPAHRLWPATDLDAAGSVGDEYREFNGIESQGLTYSGGGGVRVYPLDRLAIRVGGRYSYREIRDDWEVELSVGQVDLDILIVREPALTLSPRFEGGIQRTEISPFFVSNFDQDFYSAGIYLTLSFPGADSLVVLNRNYY